MKEKITIFIYFVIFIPVAKGAIPGRFFWKPRLGLDLKIPTKPKSAILETIKENYKAGRLVPIEAFHIGLTVVSVAGGLNSRKVNPHLNPVSAYYYTNLYRWALRHISLLPEWLRGLGINYCGTHKVWTRRFHYMDEFVPHWLRTLLFYVDKEEWAKEEKEFKKFQKYAAPAFGKYYHHPNKKLNDYKGQKSEETLENLRSFSSFIKE